MSLCLAEVVGLLWVTTNLAPGSPPDHSLMSVCFAEVLGLLWVTTSLTATDVFAFLAEVAGLLWVTTSLTATDVFAFLAEVAGLLWVTTSLTATDVFAFLAEVAGLLWVKALLCSSIHSPVGRLGHVVRCCEGLEAVAVIVALHQTVEAWVVNPCPPFSVNFKLKARQ